MTLSSFKSLRNPIEFRVPVGAPELGATAVPDLDRTMMIVEVVAANLLP
jgi:hypothetical protein